MEELKLILETVSDLGGSAKWLFIVYMVKDLLIYLAGFSCLFFALFRLAVMAQGFIKSLSLTEQIKIKMGFKGELSSSERTTIFRTLDRGLDKPI